MKREQLEHVLRAAADVVKQRDFLVIGSAAILGTYPDTDLPLEATRSDEADLAPFDDDDQHSKSFLIEGSLGQGSLFHQTYGYYADGVDFGSASAPAGWERRLVPFDPRGASPGRGLCLEPHDLAAAKLAAGRDKDYEFVAALLDGDFIDLAVLSSRIAMIARPRILPARLNQARRWLRARADARQ